MKMFKNMFSGKKDKIVKEEKVTEIAEETLKAQDAPRSEPLKGTEVEIEKQAEDGLKVMGLTPVTETAMIKDYEAQEKAENNSEPEPGAWRPRIRGNDYCPCGSNKKFKKCCAADSKKVEKFAKTMDIRLVNDKTTKKIKNEEIRKIKKDKRAEILKKVEEAKMKKNDAKTEIKEEVMA